MTLSDLGSPSRADGSVKGATSLDSEVGDGSLVPRPLRMFIPNFTVPSTITTTLTPTSSARIFEDIVESPVAATFAADRAASFSDVTRFGFLPGAGAAGAVAAA